MLKLLLSLLFLHSLLVVLIFKKPSNVMNAKNPFPLPNKRSDNSDLASYPKIAEITY